MPEDVPYNVRYYVNEAVGDTRHVLRGEMAEAVRRVEKMHLDSCEQATAEHGQVRRDLAQLTTTLVTLNGKVESVLPLIPAVAALQTNDAVDRAAVVARDQLLAGQASQRRWTIGTAVTVCAVVVAALQFLH